MPFSEISEMISTVKNESSEEIRKLREEEDKLSNELVTTRLELENHQQYINRDTFKFCNVPKPELRSNEKEDVCETVTKVLDKVGMTVTENDFSTLHRIPARDESGTKIDGIIVKCVRRDLRNKIIRHKKPMRENEDFKAAYPNVFMVEHLTPLRSKVCYQLRQDPEIAKCWTIDGRIKVLKVGHAVDAKPKTINSLTELTGIGWSDERVRKLVLDD